MATKEMMLRFAACAECKYCKIAFGEILHDDMECRYCHARANDIPTRFERKQTVRYNSMSENRKPKMIPVMFDEFALQGIHSKCYKELDVQKVILSGRATIIFWNDGTKTVVKCAKGDEYDPEKGVAMAISKKIFGNKGSYQYKIKKMIKNAEKEEK